MKYTFHMTLQEDFRIAGLWFAKSYLLTETVEKCLQIYSVLSDWNTRLAIYTKIIDWKYQLVNWDPEGYLSSTRLFELFSHHLDKL